MKKTKLLKSILIPTLGISAISAAAAISTSCGSKNSEDPDEKQDSIHVTDVTLNKHSTTLSIGDTETLIPTVLPEYATDKSVAWTSSDTNVATVDSNGTITAVGIGNATITVTTHDGRYTATCDVVVRIKPYVVITANAASTLTLKNNGENNPNLQYSIDGASWSTYDTTINIDRDQTLYLKGNNSAGWSTSNSIYSYFSITGDVSISGNVMALLDNGATSGEQGDITDIPCNYCFFNLFENSTGITSVSEDFLPATNLKQDCYDGMFYQCTSLTNAPKLSSMSLAVSCYQHMFNGCTSLTTAPELPATTLAEGCYRTMFKNCSYLTTAPNLPATSLTGHCYDWMFQNCSSLKVAPTLPATTLADSCYYGMFNNCTALTIAPWVPATSLVSGCYGRIFDGCSSLNSIKISYIGDYSSTYFDCWVNGVASSGTFYYNGSQTAQDFKLPSGWTTSKF